MYNGKDNGSIAFYNWFAFEFWRFVFVQQQVAPRPPKLWSNFRRCGGGIFDEPTSLFAGMRGGRLLKLFLNRRHIEACTLPLKRRVR
jgi:hypothetical protein